MIGNLYPYDVKINHPTYQWLSRLTTLLLLMAFLVPSGLHAKQLVELCMGKNSTVEMSANHSCCESDAKPAEHDDGKTLHHNCDWEVICACNIGQTQLGDREWIISNHNFTAFIPETEGSGPLFNTIESIRPDQNKRIGQHDPPLWLLYDTFLN